MPLISCPECHGKVATAADACPHCGHPVRPPVANDGSPSGEATPSQKTGYQPRPTVRSVRPIVTLLALTLLGVGLYSALIYLPDHDLSSYESAESTQQLLVKFASDIGLGKKYLHPNTIVVFRWISWIMVVLGAFLLLTACIRTTSLIGFCAACDCQVNVRRAFLGGWKCERCNGRVRL